MNNHCAEDIRRVAYGAVLLCVMLLSASTVYARSNSSSMSVYHQDLFAVAGRFEDVPVLEDSVSQDMQRTGVFSKRHASAAQERKPFLVMLNSAVNRSVVHIDSTWLAHRDSSARIAQFKYVRKDYPAVDGTYHETPSYFLPDPIVAVYNKDELDSTRWVYRLRRVAGDADIRIPTEVPFEEYTQLRLARAIRKNWETLMLSNEPNLAQQNGLAEAFNKITNIEIPIAKNPLFSIFGKNYIRLQINGSVDLHAAFQHQQQDAFTTTVNQSTSTPEFSQQLQITINGEIGDKLKIGADWNTQRTFDYENQLHVNYKGYDDEIVQSVEAGNVSLQTNSSFISSSSALFGIKAAFQFGPLKLTTLASQKKGQVKEMTAGGGSSSSSFSIRPDAYLHDQYFFVDTSYIGLYEDYYLNSPHLIHADKQIQDIEVWVTPSKYTPQERKVLAYMDTAKVGYYQRNRMSTSQNPVEVSPDVEYGWFIPLTKGVDYTYIPEIGVICLKTNVNQDQAIAVAYTVRANGVTQTTGNFGALTPPSDTTTYLSMKLVRPRYLGSLMKTAWSLMLKNHYLIGQGLSSNNFTLNIQYTPSGQPPVQTMFQQNVNLLTMFGLDRYSGKSNGTSGADGVFDYMAGYTIDESRGELIFPTVEPFDSLSIYKMLKKYATGFDETQLLNAADSLQFDNLYDTTASAASQDGRNRFTFTGTSSSSVQSQYYIGSNVVEGSVQVLANGQAATLNADYTVDYVMGTVTIRNQAYLVGGRTIQIKYEANDLFQLASKTLTGVRGEVDLGRNSSLGFTYMNLNEQSLSDKVRLGEEPMSNSIMGIDAGTKFDLPFLSKALNWLPGVHTLAKSELSLKGEYAYMSPNPNTRPSPVPADGGKSAAYIDDFEGSLETIPISVAYTAWHDASAPYYSSTIDTTAGITPNPNGSVVIPTPTTNIMSDVDKMEYKAHAILFSVLSSDVSVTDLYADRITPIQGQSQVPALNFYFNPAQRGAYNYSMNLDSLLFRNPTKTWGGAQLVLGSSSTNLSDQNINYIQLWVKVINGDINTKLNIDLGYISEDVIPNGKLNTEDGLTNNGIPTGALLPGEDVGIDELTDAQEDSTFKSFINKYPQYAADPSGDDYKQPPTSIPTSLDTTVAKAFDGCNGVEGNGSTTDVRFPDTEDLNGDGNVNTTNSYFEYEISLTKDTTGFGKYITGKGPVAPDGTRWYQVTIPLQKFTRQIGSPTMTDIQGMRLWVTGANGPVLFRVADFNLVGNQWRAEIANDSILQVSAVNHQDNSLYDSPIPPVQDPTQTASSGKPVFENEQSLDLIINNLIPGDSRRAKKDLGSRPIDVLNYHTMKMLVHGQADTDGVKQYGKFHYTDTSSYDARFYFRFGNDTSNYYEYSEPLHPGWDGNDVTISFADLSSLKAKRKTIEDLSGPVPGGHPGALYFIKGSPSLTSIKYLSVGVQNHMKDATLNGEVWIDELRLIDVDDSPGSAYKVDVGLKFADIATAAFSFTHTSPTFHQLETQFGNRDDALSWNFTGNISFDKFLPDKWQGTVLNFSYSHSESYDRPIYMPGTDIVATNAVQQRSAALQSRPAEMAADSAARSRDLDSLRAARTYGDSVAYLSALAADSARLAADSVVLLKAGELLTSSQTLTITESYALPGIHLNIPLDTWLITKTINQMSFGYSYNTSYQRTPTMEWAKSWTWTATASYNIQFAQDNYVKPFKWLGKFFLTSIWEDLTIYFTPRGISTNASLNRTRSESRTRSTDQTITTNDNPINRDMEAQRSLNFNWQLFEGKYLALGADYQVSISSSLYDLETDKYGRERSLNDILADMFLSDRLINFGSDRNYAQTITLSPKITVPKIWILDRMFSPSAQYSAHYNWTNNPAAGDFGKSAAWGNNISLSTGIDLHPLSELLWPQNTLPAASSAADTGSAKKSPKVSIQLAALTRLLFKNTIFDFERFNISFSQTNSVQNTGVTGGNGFANLFARVPFVQSSLPENGPSLLYQLGFSSDPGQRAYAKTGGTIALQDAFSQSNTMGLHTSRPLWDGAHIDLNWKLSWTYGENKSFSFDTTGSIIPSSITRTSSATLERSFLAFPPVFIFKFLNTSIENVDTKFEALKNDTTHFSGDDKRLSQAFQQGFEAIPFLSQIFGSMMPRLNWSFQWSGLEKLPLFKSFASSVSLEHAYSSSYVENRNTTSDGQDIMSRQTVSYAFSPLIGMSFDIKGMSKGSLNALFSYNTSSTFDLSPSSLNAIETDQSTITATVTYRRQGFEFPFLGLSLSNDLDASMTYSYSASNSLLYDFNAFNKDGTPQGGSTQTTMEPRIKYVLSARISASLYYRYTRLAPTAGSLITGSTTNEGGIDVHIAIQ